MKEYRWMSFFNALKRQRSIKILHRVNVWWATPFLVERIRNPDMARQPVKVERVGGFAIIFKNEHLLRECAV